jgi:3-isopropylmalate/(R)-2-methylmalate dehydratase small subunit
VLDRICGRVVRLAFDDVNTDVIAPNEFRAQLKEGDHTLAALRPHVFRDIRPGLDGFVQPGDVFVVGKNFGAGSHREEAVRIFQVWGVQAVVTESTARIWFRNAIAAGLPAFEVPDATKLFGEGDQIEIDMGAWRVRNLTSGAVDQPVPSFPPTVMRILSAGGIMPLLKERLRAETGATAAGQEKDFTLTGARSR